MGEPFEYENFIPLRRGDLITLLCGDPSLKAEEQLQFAQFCQQIAAIYHFEYHGTLERLKTAYACFNPDADIHLLREPSRDERLQTLNDLFAQFAWLMERANYQHLTIEEIGPAIANSSHWGLVTDIDFSIFERLAIFARGDSTEKRPRRRLGKLLRKEQVDVPIYERLVMILKLRPHHRLGNRVDTSKVYLQIFKNIPKLDISMLLPGARPRMSRLDMSKIGLPFLTGLLMAFYNIAGDIGMALLRATANPTALVWALATAALGYGTKSYFSYVGTRRSYVLHLTQTLYFQNLDTNAGVLFRVLDEAEGQEWREAVLGYFFLWRQGGAQGLTADELARCIERELESRASVKIHFEISDAIAKLEKLRIVEKCESRYRTVPLEQSLQTLSQAWQGYFALAGPREAAHEP